jgi:parallel beta-helix repeat protein
MLLIMHTLLVVQLSVTLSGEKGKMRKVSVYAFMILFLLFISSVIAGAFSAVNSKLSNRRMENAIHIENDGAPAPGWLSGWQYRKSHIINAAEGAGSDYQIRITVHYGFGADTDEDVYCNDHCRTDFGDIRFTDSSGAVLLAYWMENKTDGDNAVFWVKVADDLSSSSVTIYVYYGNTSASTTSNGSDTFQVFEEYRNDFYSALGTVPLTDYPNGNDPGDYFLGADTLDSVYLSCAMWFRFYGGKKLSITSDDLHFEEYASGGNSGHNGIDIRMRTSPAPTGWQPSNDYTGTATLDRKHIVVLDCEQPNVLEGHTYVSFCADWHVTDDIPYFTMGTTYTFSATTRATEEYIYKGALNHILIDAWELGSQPYFNRQDFYNIWYCAAKYVNPEPTQGGWGSEEVSGTGVRYIRADGSIDPPTAPIDTLDNVTYALTGDINADADGIVIQRDNIVLDGAGFTVTGNGSYNGTTLAGRSNVTVRNMTIGNFGYGIWLNSSSNNVLSGNNIADNWEGIVLNSSINNVLSGNSVTANDECGIAIDRSSNNVLSGNNITSNNGAGLFILSSSSNFLFGNNVTSNNWYGILLLYSSSNNVIFHNNFANNWNQFYMHPDSENIWDNGYPSGGNYWSDYSGTDLYHGPYQNETGNDGVGDAPYTIDANNLDNYPLMKPWSPPDIAVMNLTSAKTIIGRGYTGSINVTFENLGSKIEAFNATVYANSTIIHSEQIMLAMTNSTISFKWNTTGFAYGNYKLSAYAEPVPDETDTKNNNFTDGRIKVSIPDDLNGDFRVSLSDLSIFARAYNSHCANYHYQGEPASPNWNPNADVNDDGIVNLADLSIMAKHFNQHYP